MRIRIQHRTAYIYDHPPSAIIQVLRLTPRNHEGQRIRTWRIDLDHDVRLQNSEDAFGNVVHTLSSVRSIDDFTVTVLGEAETQETHGVVRGTRERFPPGLFLRETPLTAPDADIRAFARDAAGAGDMIDRLHKLMIAIHRQMTFDTASTTVTTTAAKALALKRGVCQDFAHVFIAAARSLGIPARYISGYMLRTDGIVQQGAAHAWAEAHVPDVGWIAFDPANGISPSRFHIRVATGLDYLGAAPVRGAQMGGAAESLQVSVSVDRLGNQ